MKALLREALAVAVVAGVVLQSMRHFVAERYVVPSGSMQPVLYGSERDGDVVLVDKLAEAHGLSRYDLGVFAPETSGDHFVKRVVSLGGEWIELRDGDLFAGPAEQRLLRQVKHPLDARDLRVPWLRWPQLGNQEAATAAIELLTPIRAGAGPGLPNFASIDEALALCREAERRRISELEPQARLAASRWLAVVHPVDATYLDARSRRSAEGRDSPVHDIGLDLSFAPRGVRELLLRIDQRPDAWLLRFDLRTGAIGMSRNGEPVLQPQQDAAATARAIAVDRDVPVRIEFGRLDGSFFFCLDGRSDTLWTMAMLPEQFPVDPGPSAWMLPTNGIAAAVVADAIAPIVSIEVFRDIHWLRPPLDVGAPPGARRSDARHVPDGFVYLLGDNSVDSRDSRMFGPVPIASFVGRPTWVLGPWPYTRKLAR